MTCYSAACSTRNHEACDGTVICLIAAHGNDHACACLCHPQGDHPGNAAIAHVMRFLLERGYVIIAPDGNPVTHKAPT